MTETKTLVMPVMIWKRTGGLEKVSMDIASTFRSMGWRVKVYSVFDQEPIDNIPGIEVISISPFYRWPRLLLKGKLARLFLGIWGRFLWKPILASQVRKDLKHGGLLIFGHAHLLPLLDFLPSKSNVRKWCWVYGIDVWGSEAAKWAAYLNQLERVVSVSSFTADQVIKAGVTVPVDIVPPFVDDHQFTPTTTPEKIRRNEILICGRISTKTCKQQYKGHDILLESLPIAERKLGWELSLRIVGTGDDVNRLRAKTEQLGLKDKVIFTGRLPFPELLEAYRHCAVFCMPSTVHQSEKGYWTGEGFGIVYVEAAACGRPVVASKDGGAPETILPDVTGLLANPRSPEEVAAAIAAVLRDPQRSDAMGKSGREMAEQNFSREMFTKKISQLIDGKI